MKALSIMQPWAFAICRLGKRIENRTWRASPSLIGTWIAIHASKREDVHVDRLFPGYTFGKGAGAACAIVAVATLKAIVTSRDEAARLGQAEWWADRPGNVGHFLADVVELRQPIAIAGALSYWQVPDEVARQIVWGHWKDGAR